MQKNLSTSFLSGTSHKSARHGPRLHFLVHILRCVHGVHSDQVQVQVHAVTAADNSIQ